MLEFEDRVLLHIPKCGGTSILTAFNLDVWNGDKPYNEKYKVKIHYDDVHQTHIPAHKVSVNKPKIAIVRNPWDRTVSRYFYCKKRYKITEDFETFVKLKVQKVDYNWGPPSWRLQKDWIDSDTKIFKIEDGLNNIFEELGFTIKIPLKNSMNIKNYNIYTKELNNIVTKYYEEDIDTFNY